MRMCLCWQKTMLSTCQLSCQILRPVRPLQKLFLLKVSNQAVYSDHLGKGEIKNVIVISSQNSKNQCKFEFFYNASIFSLGIFSMHYCSRLASDIGTAGRLRVVFSSPKNSFHEAISLKGTVSVKLPCCDYQQNKIFNLCTASI